MDNNQNTKHKQMSLRFWETDIAQLSNCDAVTIL